MSDPFDDRLRSRLERLTAAIPVDPLVTADAPPRRRSLRVVLVPPSTPLLLSLGPTSVTM